MKKVEMPGMEVIHNVRHVVVITYPDGSKKQFPPTRVAKRPKKTTKESAKSRKV